MKRALRDKWVTALRSGDYQQGYDKLRTDSDLSTSYCCLGVLCDIIDPNRWTTTEHWATPPEWRGPTNEHDYFEGTTYLENEFDDESLATIGLTSDQQRHLIRMNDGHEPFTNIANEIEELVPVEDVED